MIGLLKDLPIRATPAVIYLAACMSFGELVIRLPVKTEAENALAFAMGIFTFASGALFFLKILFNWPRTAWLHVSDGSGYMG